MNAAAGLATGLIACRGVSVEYGVGRARVLALDDVDVEVQRGESVALWGRSGSGKTTLLHVLGGLVTPTKGQVMWGEVPLLDLDSDTRASLRSRGMAYVFQGSSLLPHFTAYENVQFARVAAGAVQDDRAQELLELVGLGGKLDALPSELSGGEGQRVAIARALAQDPQLLLCDEPTGQLDSDTSRRVLDLLDALRRELELTLVVATHDASVAARYDRTIELTDGAIVADIRP